MRSTGGITSGGAFGPAGGSAADLVHGMAAAVRGLPEPGRGVQAAQEAEALLGLIEAASARLLAAVAVMDADGVVEADIALTVPSWLSRRTRAPRREGAATVRLARRLHTDPARPLPATAAALAAGDVTLAQAEAIADATAHADPELMPALEAVLLDHADLPAEALRRSAKALVQRLREQAAAVPSDAVAAGPHRGGRWLTLTDTFDGWVRVEGMLDAVDAAGLRAALHPLAKPVTTTDEAGHRCHEVRSPGERLADALMAVVDLSIRAPEAPTSGGARAHVTVVVDADRLLAADTARRAIAGQLALPTTGDPPDTSELPDPSGQHDTSGQHDPPATSGLPDLAAAYLAAGQGTGLVGARTLDGGPIDQSTLARLWCDAVVDWALVTTDPTRIRAAREGPPGAGGIDERLVREVLTAISPALGGTPLEVLAMGQQIRTANRPQRRASTIGARGCAVHGCDIPARYCQIHHEEEFADGGPTDHANHALLCPGHHRLVHHHGWTLRRDHTHGHVHLDPPATPSSGAEHPDVA